MNIVRVDSKGRVLIPKKIREIIGIREGGYIKIVLDGDKIIISPVKPNSEKYYGAFKVDRWPSDLDDFLLEAVRKWWLKKAT